MKPLALPCALALALSLTAFAVPAAAYMPPSPVQNLLYRAKDPVDLRAQLRAHRDSVAATDSLDAGEAWYWLGVSHGRSGELEPAIEAFRRSHAIRGNREDIVALCDALLQRGGRPAGEEVTRLLEPMRPEFEGDRTPSGAVMRLRAAYARALMGDATAACAGATMRRTDLLAPRTRFAAWPLWATRFAPLLAGAGMAPESWALMAPLLVASRGRDTALVRLAGVTASGRPFTGPLETFLARESRRADSLLANTVPGATARRVAVRPSDGASLAAWAIPAGARAPLALIVVSPDAPAFADADSLLTQLRRAGIAVALLDPRGSRGSASAASPWPHSWLGREDAFQRRLALDVSAAIAPALAATGADPARVCVITEGSCAMGAALAARGDSRIRALLLASAAPSGAERGWLRATLADAAVPVFFQQGPEDVTGNEVMDRIASLLPPRLVRIADSQSGGSGLALFRAGPATGQRFSDWVRGQWKARPATPPARRR